MHQDFTPFIKAIGAGKRAGRYLTEPEAFSAMRMLLAGEITPEQKGAFLMLLRVREESVDELSGFVRACRTFLPHYKSTSKALSDTSTADIDIACYAGKRRQLPWFLLALGLLHQNGFRLFVHGTAEPHSQRLYVRDALNKLGLLHSVHAKSTSDASSKIASRGIAYMDLQDFHSPLNEVIQLRELFGLRSCANTLARLLNPMNAKFSVQGVHHQGIDEKHARIAANLHDKNVLCFRGEGGEPEVNPAKATTLNLYQDDKKPSFTQIELPAKQSWQIKPKTLDMTLLMDCWSSNFHPANDGSASNNDTNSYAYNSVISTTTSIIMMTRALPMAESTELAKRWWLSRNKTMFLSVDIADTSVPSPTKR